MFTVLDALQAATSSNHPILLLTLPKAGHGGDGFTHSKVEVLTDQTEFLIKELGVNP